MALTTGFQLPFGIQPLNPVPTDSWSGPFEGINAAAAIAAANAAIPPGVRFKSLEVRLIINGSAVKYWYKDGVLDTDLIEFQSTVSNAYTVLPLISSVVTQIGTNNTFLSGSANSVILGGSNNTIAHSNTFVLGSNVTTVSANFTYVNNISATQEIRANVIVADSITDTHGGTLVKKKTFTIVGNGVSQQFTLNHNFNTYETLVQVYEYDTKEAVMCYVKSPNTNNTLIDVGASVTAGVSAYLVVIFC